MKYPQWGLLLLSASLVACTSPSLEVSPKSEDAFESPLQGQATQNVERVRFVYTAAHSFKTQAVETAAVKFLRLTLVGDGISTPLRHQGEEYIPVHAEGTDLVIDNIPTQAGKLRVVTVQGYDENRQALTAFVGKGFYLSRQAGDVQVEVDRRHLLSGLALELFLAENAAAASAVDLAALQQVVDQATEFNDDTQQFGKDPLRFNPQRLLTLLMNNQLTTENLSDQGEYNPVPVRFFTRTPDNCAFQAPLVLTVDAPGVPAQTIAPGTHGVSPTDWSLYPGLWRVQARTEAGTLLDQTHFEVTGGGLVNFLSGPGGPGGGSFQSAWAPEGLPGRIEAYTISTVAGGGVGDGGEAAEASLNNPQTMVRDAQGNVYISSAFRIRRVNTSGTIETIAGNGVQGFSGDGGPATSAQISGVTGMAIDAQGNLYLADTFSHRIRKVTPEGIISTIAGTGQAGFAGDNGPALQADLKEPMGLEIDSQGRLWIADNKNYRIRRIENGVITTVAGTGTPGKPETSQTALQANIATSQLAFDTSGNLLINNTLYGTLYRIHPDQTLSIVAGNGISGSPGTEGSLATDSSFSQLSDFETLADGSVVFSANCRVFQLAANGTFTTLAGSNCTPALEYENEGLEATAARFGSSLRVAHTASGDPLIADVASHRVFQLKNGQLQRFAGGGAGDGSPGTSAQLDYPRGLALDAEGNLLIVDNGHYRVRKLNAQGVISTIAGNGLKGMLGDGGPAVNARLYLPQGIAADSTGNVYIGDSNNNTIRKIDPQGQISTAAHTAYPVGLAIGSDGQLYFSEPDNNRVRLWDPVTDLFSLFAGQGNIMADYAGDGGPALQARFSLPWSVYVAPNQDVYISDAHNSMIRRVDAQTKIISRFAGTLYDGARQFTGEGGPADQAKLGQIFGVTGDRCGNIYFSDALGRIVRVDASSQKMETIAGGTIGGFAGDNGPALQARFNFPRDLVVDQTGNIYVSDSSNQRIRKLTPQFAP